MHAASSAGHTTWHAIRHYQADNCVASFVIPAPAWLLDCDQHALVWVPGTATPPQELALPPQPSTSQEICCCACPPPPPLPTPTPLPAHTHRCTPYRDQPQIIDYVRLKGQATTLQGSVADMRRKLEVAAGLAATARRGSQQSGSGSAGSTKRTVGPSAGTLKGTMQ
jgi:hypothetical protein